MYSVRIIQYAFTLLLGISLSYAGSDESGRLDAGLYLSPGVRIGYIWGEGISISGKLSLGVAFGDDYSRNNFVNVTFGMKRIFVKDRSKLWYNPYTYKEVQFGTFQRDLLPVYIGGSLGVYGEIGGVKNNSGIRWSAFSGMLGFASFEFESFERNIPLFDVGIVGVFPVPIDRGNWQLSF